MQKKESILKQLEKYDQLEQDLMLDTLQLVLIDAFNSGKYKELNRILMTLLLELAKFKDECDEIKIQEIKERRK